ncbi:MAG: aryl-sulfate sulfotransferase [Candidatus Hodarchaeota archaeon]
MTRYRLNSLLILTLFALSVHISVVTVSPTVSNSSSLQIEQSLLTPETTAKPDVQHVKATVLDADVTITKTDASFDGYNLFVLGRRNITENRTTKYLVITDMYGESIAERQLGYNFQLADVPAEFINSTTILYATGQGAYLWNYYTDETVYLGIEGHHEYEHNSKSDTYFTLVNYNVEIDDELYLFDRIEEYNASGHLVWSLDTRLFISHTQWCPYSDIWGGSRDVSHANSIFYDGDEDVIYLNARNVNTFYKIDHSTGNVIWALGEYGDFTLYNETGGLREELFYHAHAVEKIDSNTFILFDNDYHNQLDGNSRYSRIVEITINTDTMIANESWVWTAPRSYWSIIWGDADRLPNGSRLGVFGAEWHPDSPYSAILVEVDDSKNIVWQMMFGKSIELSYVVYRMERFRFTPTLNTPEDQIIPRDEPVNVAWDVLYNFRNKMTIASSYSLLLNDSSVDDGIFLYQKYWNIEHLEFSLGILEKGTHNITLVVSDNEYNQAADTVIVRVVDFYITRDGPTSAEAGQSEAVIVWSGVVFGSLYYNYTIDDFLEDSGTWIGQDITLDLGLQPIGSHEVFFRLFNLTHEVHNESFFIAIIPPEPPDIHLISEVPTEMSWDQLLNISWEIADFSGGTWSVLVNGNSDVSGEWDGHPLLLNWTSPFLNPGLQNITLEVTDKVGLSNSSTHWVTVLYPPGPAILTTPNQDFVVWGSEGVSFIWTIVGATEWSLYRNGTLHAQGTPTGLTVEVFIVDWWEEEWLPMAYNLTLLISNGTVSVSETSFIDFLFDPGDSYVDEVVTSRSMYYTNGESTIGAPDGIFASIFLDYFNGYMTLDMGEQEEIIDEEGMDFTVYSRGGTYSVSVINDLDDSPILLATVTGNQSFDLSLANLAQARYVRIDFFSGDTVEIDAIEAIHHNFPEMDRNPPQINAIDDFWIWENQTSILLRWSATDKTPWRYSIEINGEVNIFGIWNGCDIVYTFQPSSLGVWNSTLLLQDAFGNKAADVVLIEVRRTPLSEIVLLELLLLAIGLVASGAILGIILLRRIKYKPET